MFQKLDSILMLNHFDKLFIKFDLTSHVLTILEWNSNTELVIRLAFLKLLELEGSVLRFPVIE